MWVEDREMDSRWPQVLDYVFRPVCLVALVLSPAWADSRLCLHGGLRRIHCFYTKVKVL